MRLAALVFVLLIALAGESRAANAFGPNAPGSNASAGEGTKYLREGTAAASKKKPKVVAGAKSATVNKSGAKGATTAKSEGGRVFLTRPGSSVPATGAARKKETTRATAASKAAQPAKKLQMSSRSAAPNRVVPVVLHPPTAKPAPDSTPRIELTGPRETPAVAPPAMNPAPAASGLPPAPAMPPPEAPATPVAEPVPLVSHAPLPAVLTAGGTGGAPVAVIPGVVAHRSAAKREQLLRWYYVMGALLLLIIVAPWIRGLRRKPWLSYTEDWVDGFLWRWEWKRTEVTNLRGFCPTCRSEVLFRPLPAEKDAPPESPAVATWAFCPKCKEATCLEMSDVPRAVATTLTRKRKSGEYRETVASAKRKAGISTDRSVRIKVVDGRVV